MNRQQQVHRVLLLSPVLLGSIVAMQPLIAATSNTAAPTYYVATNGNDSNPCSINQPCQTIQAAVNKIANGGGGTIYLRGGTYLLDSNPWVGEEHDGSVNSRLVIRPYQKEKVILDGNSKAKTCISIGGQYVDIVGLECRNVEQGIVGWGAKNLRVKNNIVHNTQATGIGIYGQQLGGTSDIVVDGNKVYRTNLNNKARDPKRPGWGCGITISRGKNATVTNNRVFENYGEGIIAALSDNVRAANNTVYDNYSAGMYMDNATNTVFENNLAYHTGNKEFFRNLTGQRWQPDAGIALNNEKYSESNPLNNNIVRNNVVIGTFGLNISSVAKNTQIVNNTFYKATQQMLNIEPLKHENVAIANNIFYQTQGKPMTYDPNLKASPGLRFSHNLWFGGNPGAAAGTGDIKADPMFIKPGSFKAGDYKLKAGSPAIDRGIVVKAATKDFFGDARKCNKGIDIGADELCGK